MNRRLAVLFIAATFGAGLTSRASAQVTFAGVTTYAFNGGGLAPTATIDGLTVTEDGFDVTTTPLIPNVFLASIGGVGNNFGRVSLSALPFFYLNIPFELRIAFTTPLAGNQLFFATVLGAVNGSTVGGVTFTFDPSTISSIPFTNGPGSGTFDITVNNVSVNAGAVDAQLTGQILAQNLGKTTSTPEPASMVMVATGLVAVLGVARRRRNDSRRSAAV